MSQERNLEICHKYQNDGITQEALAEEYGITKVRVGQILHASGLDKTDRGKKPGVRSTTIGVMIKPGVKRAVENLAASESKSLSKWVSDLIEEVLAQKGIDFLPPKEPHLRLPLEG